MTVRTGRGDRSLAALAAAAFLVPLLLAGCATPHTHFDWGVRQGSTRQVPPPRHVNRVAERQCPPGVYGSVPEPTPRPTPAWYRPAPETPASTAPNTAEATEPAAAGSTKFAWPLKGRIISDYGASSGGARNDGINIATADGEPIRAAADGVVSYTGNALKGYGNLTLIKHDNGYVTAYAHAERFVVNRGDHVMRGQVIGYAGQSGDVDTPQLHFEIRSGMKPVNPHPLLGPLQMASR